MARKPSEFATRGNRKICKSAIKKQSFPETNLDRLGKTGGYLQLRSFTFFALHGLYSGPAFDPASWWLSRRCDSAQPPLLQRSGLTWAKWQARLARSVHWPNNKHRLQEELWHLAFTTSTVAPLQVARLGWLLRQAHLTRAIRKICR